MPRITKRRSLARRRSGRRGKRRRGTRERSASTGEEVYFLPGTIDISSFRELEAIERGPGGGKLMVRHMVRGHWRRAAPQ